MTTTVEQLNDLIQAGNAWQAQANTLLANRIAHQQGYEALANNLRGVVTNLMTFSGTVDPDNLAPTNIDGGTFNTIKALIDASPAGAYIVGNLLAGKTYQLNADINLFNRTVMLLKSGVGANPIIKPMGYVGVDNTNWLYSFSGFNNSLYLNIVDVDLSAAKADAALAWNVLRRCLVIYRLAAPMTLSVVNARIVGSGGAHLINGAGAATIFLGIFNTTLDGDIFAASSVNIALISHNSVTLLNGAAINNGGTLGATILKN